MSTKQFSGELSVSENRSVRFRTAFDDAGLIALTNTTYPDKEISNREYLNWEYDANPDGKAILALEERTTYYAGQYVVLPRRYFINDRISLGSLSVNTLTHPKARGQGVFPRLAELVYRKCDEDGVEFTIGFPNEASRKGFQKALHFTSLPDLGLYVRPLSFIRSGFNVLFKRKAKDGSEIDLSAEKVTGIELLDLNKDKTEYEEFLPLFNRIERKTTYRSPEFMDWRYCRIPLRKYLLLKEITNGRISAVLAFRARYIYGLRCGILVDVMTDGTSGSGKNLLKYIHQLSLKNKLDLLLYAGSNESAETKVVHSSGLFKISRTFLPQQITPIIRMHNGKLPDVNGWHFSFGDGDVF